MKKIKILVVFGTRPEAIKLFPLIRELKKDFNLVLCSTSQHKAMLNQVLNIFDIRTHYDLNIMKNNQTLFDISKKIFVKFQKVLQIENPNLVLVQGDTTTAMISALSSFYLNIPVAHVESGLRTYDNYSPFPEEMNRNIISKISYFHFCPTSLSKKNLFKENIKKHVYITGNTIVDCLILFEKYYEKQKFSNTLLNKYIFNSNNKIILITMHRRENFGKKMYSILLAIKKIAISNTKINLIFPVHKNPKVRNIAFKILTKIENVKLINPINYLDNLKLIKNSLFIISDSGGIQEEAPSFGVPLLLTRENTERPEGVESNNTILVGTDKNKIVYFAHKLINNINFYKKYSKKNKPYGDGKASIRIKKILNKYYENH